MPDHSWDGAERQAGNSEFLESDGVPYGPGQQSDADQGKQQGDEANRIALVKPGAYTEISRGQANQVPHHGKEPGRPRRATAIILDPAGGPVLLPEPGLLGMVSPQGLLFFELPL